MAYDQPDNAVRLKQLGVADWLSPRRFRGPAVAAKLQRLLDSPDVADQCQTLARKLEGTNALEDACDLVEALIHRWVKLDLDGMLEFFLEQGRVTIPSGWRISRSYEDMFFSALAKRDPRGAVEAALRFPAKKGCLNKMLGKIASRHRCVNIRELASLNDVRPPRYTIRIGQTLKVPNCS